MGLCENKVAIVTGAAGNGMGRSIALTLAREGAAVVVNYRSSRAQATAVVDHIRKRGGAAVAAQADVFTADGCRALVSAAEKEFGRVDIGIVGPGGGWHPEPLQSLNVDGAIEDAEHELAPLYHLMRLLLPGMYERRWGRIVAITQLPPHESPAYAYNAGKAARAAAAHLASRAAWAKAVTINTLAPGPVDAVDDLATAVELCDHGPAWRDRRNVTPQDIAEGAAFLCSDAGRFVAGCDLPYRWHKS